MITDAVVHALLGALSALLTLFPSTGNVTLGSGASLKTQSVTLTGFTVATLPPCSTTTKGLMAMATDVSTAPTYRQTGLTGGGSVAVPVFCNGSAYEAH